MDEKLRNKLRDISERHEELGEMLCAPEVMQDKARFLAASREHAELRPVAEAFERYRQGEHNLAEARELLSDPDMKELAEDDIGRLQKELSQLDRDLQHVLLPKDPNDSKNVVLEIRAGTGGEEAALFGSDLWRMYSRYAERMGWSVDTMNASEASAGGFREISGLIRGKNVYANLKFESGVHRVQRVPATESQGRIHTSAATVAIMPEAQEVDIEINDSDIRLDVMRASGAGGQHVNTTDSKVRLTHIPTGLAVESQQEKSQTKNREIAMILLRSRLLDMEIQKYESERAAERKSQVGSGDRSEKVRTYNYPQDRITDHRINRTRHNLAAFMDGDIGDLLTALRAHDEAERLSD
ncbi:MAG: peptide chain release factor 1 [Deltaproteobacteria bacterium]|nr:peptide chain release factor 1 [Deltaproteobacteria bacterium]